MMHQSSLRSGSFFCASFRGVQFLPKSIRKCSGAYYSTYKPQSARSVGTSWRGVDRAGRERRKCEKSISIYGIFSGIIGCNRSNSNNRSSDDFSSANTRDSSSLERKVHSQVDMFVVLMVLVVFIVTMAQASYSHAAQRTAEDDDDFSEPRVDNLELMDNLPTKLEFPYYQSPLEAERWITHYFEHPNTRIVLLACKLGLLQLQPGAHPEQIGFWAGLLMGLFERHNEMAPHWFEVLLKTSCKSEESCSALWTALLAANGPHTRKHVAVALLREQDRETRRALMQARRSMGERPNFPFDDAEVEQLETMMPLWRGYFAATGDATVLHRLIDMTKYFQVRSAQPLQMKAALARDELLYYGVEYESIVQYYKQLMGPPYLTSAAGSDANPTYMLKANNYVAPVEARQSIQAAIVVAERAREVMQEEQRQSATTKNKN